GRGARRWTERERERKKAQGLLPGLGEEPSRGTLDRPILPQGINQARRGSRRRSRRAHGKRCIAPIIAIVQAAPKTVTKIRSPRPNARPQPRPASRERAISSRKPG